MSTLATLRERRRHWRRCRALLRQVPPPDVFDVDEYAQQIARRRGRPLRVLTHRISTAHGGLCGALVTTATEDLIFVDADASPLHREHIVLHELGHVLCDHTPLAVPPRDLVAALVPDLRPELVRQVLGRTTYSTPQEAEAEVFATMAGARIEHRSAAATPTACQPSTVLAALGAMLEAEK